jgi:DNA-binding LytR/AlgR family response regulator
LKDYVKIYTIKGMIITKYAMAALEAMLPANNFLRVHRSFLISIDKIDSFTTDEIDIRGQLIPVGKLYRQQALRILNNI